MTGSVRRILRRSGYVSWLVPIVLSTAALGCGSGDSNTNDVLSMVPTSTDGPATASGENHAPVISDILIKPERPSPGRQVKAMARARDADGDSMSISYRWQTAGGRELGEGKLFDTTGLRPGSRLTVIATASDGTVESEPVSRSIQFTVPSVEISLVQIDSSAGTRPGTILTADVEVSDDFSGRVEPNLEWKVNGDVVGTGEIFDTRDQSPGDIVILRASLDRGLTRSNPISSRPLVLAAGDAPEILSTPVAGIEDGLFKYQIEADSAAPEAEFSYALLVGPDGMTVDSKSGLVRWRPTLDQRGRFKVDVSATDQWGTGVAQTFTIIADSLASPASAQ